MKVRKETWLTLIGVAVVLPVAVIVGIVVFVNVSSSSPLHTSPADVPSTSGPAPPPAWANAVKKSQEIVRAGVVEQNLPGLSVAVGVEGDIVWAEGFGWANLEKRVP